MARRGEMATAPANRSHLNLRRGRIRNICSPARPGTPGRWNCLIVAEKTGEAAPRKKPLHDSDAMYHLSGKAAMPTVYQPEVVDPGDAVPLKIPLHDSDAMYYISGKAAVPNVYQPGVVNTVQKGEGTYFAEHAVDSDRGFILQGTFFTKDIIKAAENDIIFMR